MSLCGASIVNFERIPHFFLVFHSWILGSVASWVYQQRSKYRQRKIMKHAKPDTNYAILIKGVKLQHENKPELNLNERVRFERTITNLLRFSFCKKKFFRGKKP